MSYRKIDRRVSLLLPAFYGSGKLGRADDQARFNLIPLPTDPCPSSARTCRAHFHAETGHLPELVIQLGSEGRPGNPEWTCGPDGCWMRSASTGQATVERAVAVGDEVIACNASVYTAMGSEKQALPALEALCRTMRVEK